MARTPRALARRGRRLLGYWRRERRTLTQGFVALFISSLGDLLAGLALAFMSDELGTLIGLAVLIPAAIGMRGNIFGALGSRLGTGLNSGQYRPSWEPRAFLRQNVMGSVYLTFATCLFLGFAAHAVASAFTTGPVISVWSFAVISIIGGVLGSLVVGGSSVAISVLSFRREWDLDSVSAPLVTAIGDIATLPCLYLAAKLVENAPSLVPAVGIVASLACLAATIQGLRVDSAIVRRIVRESMPVLFLAGAIDCLAGAVLEQRIDRFLALPALFILVPPFLEDTNALAGILSSRLASKLHLGVIEPKAWPQTLALIDISINFLFAFSVFFFVGFSSNLIAVVTGNATPGLATMLSISLIAGFLATIFSSLVAYYTAVATFRFGLDPDNHGIPISSSVMDLLGTLCLVLVILLLGVSAHG
jgi:mgtE-like transporter